MAASTRLDAHALIPEFFAGRSVLITGATGFMGKVLVERLLSTCPEVSQLFLLMRTKRDTPPETRLKELKQCSVFDVIRVNDPDQLDKLTIVPGDITQPELGLSEDSVDLLKEVSIVFNCAATVKFTEPLRRAVEQNVLSVMHALQLADKLRNMAAFVHVSTAYCNTEQARVEERVYAPPRPLHRLLEDALSIPDDIDQAQRFVAPKPNTYTFTKALGEVVLERHGNKRYPLAIVRPTIVVSSLRHPFPGWVDGYNGPGGVMIGISAGLERVFPGREAARSDLLPVDLAIDTMIAVAWETALDNLPSVRVYNCSTIENPTTWGALRSATLRLARRDPLRDVRAYPVCYMIQHRLVYKTLLFVMQILPLHLAEYMMRIFSFNKNRLNLIKVSERLSAMNESLQHFTHTEWRFDTDNVRRLRERLAPRDAEVFNLDPHSIHWEDFYRDFMRGCRIYLNRDKEENLPQARRRLRRIYLVQSGITVGLSLLLIRSFLSRSTLSNVVTLVLRLIAVLSNALNRAVVPLAHLAAILCQWGRSLGLGTPFRVLSIL